MEPRTFVWNNYANNVYSGVYPVGAYATNEAGLIARIEFTIYVDPNCVDQTITAPAAGVENQVYLIGDPAASYEVPEFDNSDEYCTLTYTHSDTSVQEAFMTELSGRAMQWESNNNANSGEYTIEVIASGIDDVTASISYTLTV